MQTGTNFKAQKLARQPHGLRPGLGAVWSTLIKRHAKTHTARKATTELEERSTCTKEEGASTSLLLAVLSIPAWAGRLQGLGALEIDTT